MPRLYRPPKPPPATQWNRILGDDTCPLERLPTEILLNFTDHISSVDRAALALASRTLLWKLGPNSTDIKEAETRTRLLLLLEKDNPDEKLIVCSICGVFHSPLRSTDPKYPRPRCFHPIRYMYGTAGQYSPYWLPQQVHFNLVKAIMRSHRLQNQHYDPTMISLNETYSHPTKEAKIQVSAACFVSEGKLLLRTVTVLLPCRGKERSRQTAPDLLDILRKNPRIDHCCAHFRWSSTYSFIFEPYSIKLRIVEFLLYRFVFNVWRTSTPPAFNINFINEMCPWCYTSCYFKALDLPDGSGRAVALVSIKDLGRGESIDEVEWKSHMWHSRPYAVEVGVSRRHRAERTGRWTKVPQIDGLDGRGCALDVSCFDKLMGSAQS